MSEKLLTFNLSGRLFGLDITLVKEIIRNLEYTPVPDSRAEIVGLLNLRGQVVTLFDLAKLMDYEHEDSSRTSGCIILKNSSQNPNYIGFLIDKPGDVIDVGNEIVEPLPANTGGVDSKYLREVV
ncbi:MAG: chemotaxis protein CheW, partial [Candidatus Saccharibacteria bacterium]